MLPKTSKRAVKSDDADDSKNKAPDHEVKKKNIEALTLKEEPAQQALGDIPPDQRFPESNCHVYVEDGIIYDATLNQTNVRTNNNNFYILQILKKDGQKQFFFWSRWGRVGYDGRSSFSELPLESAKREFSQQFKDKTGNAFGTKKFNKVAGKYDLIQIDYGKAKTAPIIMDDDVNENIPSELDPRLKSTIDLICDLQAMGTYLKTRMKFDSDRSPLGALQKSQIEAGFEILAKIEQCLLNGDLGPKHKDLVDSYFTKIPHTCGMKPPRDILSTIEEVKEELVLLEALIDAEAAAVLLNKKDKPVKPMNPSDHNYLRLKCQMTPLETNDPQYKIVRTYLRHTHGQTHSNYKLNLLNVFKIEREGEADTFRSDLDNQRLLWHGSGMSNWCGILLNGLRIAPPEAPVSGYMFGKGIYFADSCSKSANYCRAYVGDRAFLSLAQVALGNMQERVNADYEASKLPEGIHSTFGMGKHEPVASGSKKIEINGQTIHVPCGKLGVKEDSDKHGLLYNEFIVYSKEQVCLRFLLEVEFVSYNEED